MQDIETIEAPTKSDHIFRRLIDRIRTCKWPICFHLPAENELARSFGVSRNSVRAALQRLVALGMLDSRNGEGSFVRPYSRDLLVNSLISMVALNREEIVDLLEFRKGVEISSCELAALRRTDEQIGELEKAVASMRHQASVGDHEEFSRSDFRFHSCVARMSGNFFIENVMLMLEAPISTHFQEMSRRMRLDSYIATHGLIMEAIRDRNAAAAGTLMKESLEKSIAEMIGFEKEEKR